MGNSNKVYVAVLNQTTKVVIVRINTKENQKFLKTQMGAECKGFKVRAANTEDAFEKIKKQTGIEDLILDKSRHFNLAEIEDFSFENITD